MSPSETRSLRSDAQQNQDRILEAAAAAFAREGADTSMKAISIAAGVGIGTLYRRFPTREDLVEATYRDQTARLAESAGTLLTSVSPREAMLQWMTGFVDYMQTKDGMAEALPAILAARDGLRGDSRELLRSAIAQLLAAGAESGVFDRDVRADDVMMSLGGITMIAAYEHQRSLADRLIALLMSGLRPPG